MVRIPFARIGAIVFFLLLVIGAVFSLQQVGRDICAAKYFAQAKELRYETVFLITYLLVIIFILRYGYYLAVNRVSWAMVKDDFLYLLNQKYFSRKQWLINVTLFWLALICFIYSLAISAMKGTL